MLDPAQPPRRSARRVALTVAGITTVGGIVWVLSTDILLYSLTQDPVLVARIETAKGWAFVGLIGLLVYVVTLRIASRLTRAHAVIAAIVDSIADGVLLLGPDRTIAHANPAAVRLLRCKRAHDLIGVDAAEFSRRFRVSYLDGSLVPPDQFISQRVFREGGTLQYKAVFHPPDGEEVVISATAAAVRCTADDPAELVVSVMHDITDSEHLDHLRDQFFAAAAHSLKTPVAIIQANAQLLSRSAAPELGRSAAAIERQCARIDRLVQNLLVLARARSHTLQIHAREVSLGPLVERVAHQMAAVSAQRDVRTEIPVSPRVYADEERLAMALRNLIDEGLRSSVPGSSVTVTLRRRGADAEVGVSYRPLPLEERISATCGDHDELRLGRAVVTIVAEAHGGSLVEEAAEAEATAWIRLPAIEGAHAPA